MTLPKPLTSPPDLPQQQKRAVPVGRIRPRYDVVVAGGGHNGLVCAFYLAEAGLDVLIIERRDRVGGPCATIEPMSGFRLSFANSPGSLDPKVVSDMRLREHGLSFARPDPSLVHLFPDGNAFVAWREPSRVRDVIAGFDKRDVRGYEALMGYCEWFAERLAVSLHQPPPSLPELTARLTTPADELGYRRFFLGSLHDLLEEFLYSEQMRAVVGTLGIMSTNAGPMTPGTALMLLWRPLSRLISRAVDVDDPRNHRLRGSTGLPIGGMGAVIDAMESAARAAGVTIVTDTPVSSIDVTDDGKVAGVTFSEGSHVEAPVVSSNIDPWQTMLELVPDGAIPDALVRELQSSRPRGNAFKLALALDGVPSMHVGGNIDEGALLGCQFRIAPSLSYLERAWDDAKHGLPSQGPVFWGLIPSISDPALAPPGRHIMSVNIHLAPTQLAGGRTWQQERSAYAQRCIHALAAYYPGLQDRITDMVAWSPLDIEQQLGFVEGSITHGDMLPSNTFSMRPSPSLSRYRTPVKGLYLCGSGSFPGGYVTGLPGHNAAKEILRDRPWPW